MFEGLPENYIDPNSNFDYISSNCLPLKTISNVGNVSYDKINQMLQERHFGLSKIKNDYFMTSTGQVKSKSKKYKYTEEKIVLQKNIKKRFHKGRTEHLLDANFSSVLLI